VTKNEAGVIFRTRIHLRRLEAKGRRNKERRQLHVKGVNWQKQKGNGRKGKQAKEEGIVTGAGGVREEETVPPGKNQDSEGSVPNACIRL